METATFFKSVQRKENSQVFMFNQDGKLLLFHTKNNTDEVTGNWNCSDILGVTDKQMNEVDVSDELLSILYSKALRFNVNTEV